MAKFILRCTVSETSKNLCCLFKTRFKIIIPPMHRYTNRLITFMFVYQHPDVFPFSPIRATCFANLIILDLTTLLIFVRSTNYDTLNFACVSEPPGSLMKVVFSRPVLKHPPVTNEVSQPYTTRNILHL